MKSASEEFKKLRFMAENSLRETDELDKVLTQVETSLAPTEARKVSPKNKST